MAWLIFSDTIRVNIYKWASLILAFILIYATLFQKADYNLILGTKIAGIIPIGFIFGILYAYAFYLYNNRGLL